MSAAPVNTASWRFRLVRFVARMMLRSQYRRIEVEGAENIPADGAVMILANHFRSLVDPMALLHASPRPASFLAKAPLWKNKLLSFCLDAVGAVPVFRPQDAEENEGRTTRANLKIFQVCRERLEEGGSLALFPEGVSQPRPRLMPVRTGATRIALDAKVPVTVCPAGVVYEPPLRGRRGTLLVTFGEPFVVDDAEGYASRRAAITGITRKIESELRDLLAETESGSDMEALRTLCLVWEQEQGIPPATSLAERHRRNQLFARGLARLKKVAPGEIEELRAETDGYVRALEDVGIPPEHLRSSYTGKRIGRFLLTRLPLLLLTAPLAIIAGIITWPIRRVGDIIAVRHFGGREDMRSLCRMIGGSLMLVITMVLGAILVGMLWNWWAALAVFLLTPFLLMFHIFWRDRTLGARASIHSFFLLAGANLRETLQEQRRDLDRRLARARAVMQAAGVADPDADADPDPEPVPGR